MHGSRGRRRRLAKGRRQPGQSYVEMFSGPVAMDWGAERATYAAGTIPLHAAVIENLTDVWQRKVSAIARRPVTQAKPKMSAHDKYLKRVQRGRA